MMKKYLHRLFRISSAIVLLAVIVIPFVHNDIVKADNESTFTIVFNPTGTHIENGQLIIRLDFYPVEGMETYEQQHVYKAVEPLPDYPGEVDKTGKAIDSADYDTWYDSLPHEWVTNPALCKFVAISKNTTSVEIEDWVEATYTPDVQTTIDYALAQPNSRHLISPYLEDKGVLKREDVVSAKNVIADTNQKFQEFIVESSGNHGEVQYINPQSIDVGNGAENLSGTINPYTIFDTTNPANASGTLDTFEIWCATNLADCEIATFYNVSGSNYSTRDNDTIGSVTAGSKQTFSAPADFSTLDVETGDFIGVYYSSGTMERADSGGSGGYYVSGDHIPADNVTFNNFGGAQSRLGLYATGTESDFDWDDMEYIYYDPTEESANNSYLEYASSELETWLELATSDNWTVVTESEPEAPAIYISVNETLSDLTDYNWEGFNIVSDSNGITITGKSAIGARNGVFYLLDEILGFAWLSPSDTWTVIPSELPSLDSISETTKDPDFICRQFEFTAAYVYDWMARNRMWNDRFYQNGAVYSGVLDGETGWYGMSVAEKQAYYATGNNSDQFTPSSFEDNYPHGYYQLNPYNEDVREWFTDWAATKPNTWRTSYPEAGNMTYAAASTTPNDGEGWAVCDFADDNDEDWQDITDAVFSLTSNTSANISAQYADFLISVLAYTWYGGVPTFALDSNVLALITTEGYNYTEIGIYEQLSGMAGKGCEFGLYDYTGFWEWYKDRPVDIWSSATRIPYYYELGAEYWTSEAIYSYSWASLGLPWYITTKLLWDSTLDVDTLVDDFCEKAFTPAADDTMKLYYTALTRMDEDNDPDAFNAAYRISLLDTAEDEAADNSDAVDRIQDLECYEWFLYSYYIKGGGSANDFEGLTQGELEDLYTFVSKLITLYLVSTTSDEIEDRIAAELVSRDPTTYPNAAAVESALGNDTPPTDNEIAGYMTTMLNDFVASYELDYLYYDPRYGYPKAFEPAGDDGDELELEDVYLSGWYLVECTADETVTILCDGNFDNRDIVWYNPYEMEVDSETIGNLGSQTSYNFTAHDISGEWMLYDGGTAVHSIDIENRGVGRIIYPDTALPCYAIENNFYFNVPSGTSSFAINVSCPNGYTTVGNITDPNSSVTEIDISADTLFEFDSPTAGIWLIELPTQDHSWLYLEFMGIMPLVWHDPEYLLINSTTGNGTCSDPTFTTDNATLITGTTARLNGTISGLDCEQADDTFWEWGLSSGNYSSNYTDTTNRNNGSVYHDISGLSGSTEYFFRGAARLNGGSWQYGSELSFNTTANNTPTVVTSNATDLACGSVTGNGNMTSEGSANATTRGFQYGIGSFTDNVSESGDFETGVYDLSITGLEDNTEYQYRAFAINTYGIAYGGTVNFTTTASADPTVTTGNATSVGYTTATLNVTLSGLTCDDTSSIIFEWGTETGNYTDNWETVLPYGNESLSHGVTELSDNTTYYYRVRAKISGGSYQNGEEVEFTTNTLSESSSSSSSEFIDALPLLITAILVFTVVRLGMSGNITNIEGLVILIVVIYLVFMVIVGSTEIIGTLG